MNACPQSGVWPWAKSDLSPRAGLGLLKLSKRMHFSREEGKKRGRAERRKKKEERERKVECHSSVRVRVQCIAVASLRRRMDGQNGRRTRKGRK